MFNKKKTEDSKSTTQTSSPINPANAAPVSPARSTPPSTASAPQQGKQNYPYSSDKTDSAGKESRLHVGKDIHLKGEITACDRLIVEGKVEASMNSNEIEISESGIFIGEVVIDTADISGRFEGSLTARTKLIVRKTGCVAGDIQYGEIEIEPGGEISGRLSKTGSTQSEPELAEKVISNTIKKPVTGQTTHH